MATIFDVAKQAGVSIATVSRVINNTGTVSPETKQKVEAAISQLGYRPNIFARTLPLGQPDKVIGLIIPEIQNPVFPQIAQAVEREARLRGYQVMLCQTDGRWDVELMYTRLLIDRRVAGIIYVSGAFSYTSASTEVYQTANNAGIQYVFVNSPCPNAKVPVLASDEFEAGKMQAEFVISRGHRRIVFLGGGKEYHVTRYRLSGIKAILDASHTDISFKAHLGSFRANEAAKTARQILQKKNRPTAVICASDILALVVMAEARKLGLRVPEDVSVIGFDGIDLGEYTWPQLTTVAQPLDLLGKMAVSTLLGGRPRKEISLKLLDRGSVNYINFA